MVCMNMLSNIIFPPTQKEMLKQRKIAFTMASYNVGAVADTSYIQVITAFAGKDHMLADGFRKA